MKIWTGTTEPDAEPPRPVSPPEAPSQAEPEAAKTPKPKKSPLFQLAWGLFRSEPDPEPPAISSTQASEPNTGDTFSVLVATLVTIVSVVFTTWSVFDMATPAAPTLVAIAAGAGVELVWLYVLATEWQQAVRTGQVSRGLTITGWALAGVAAVVILVHGILTTLALAVLMVLPLAAKAGWHWKTRTRAAITRARLEAAVEAQKQEEEAARLKALADAEEKKRQEEAEVQRRKKEEEREQRLSPALTDEQRERLADLERERIWVEDEAQRLIALDGARAKVQHDQRLAEIRLNAETQMAEDEALADIHVNREHLRRKIELAAPIHNRPAMQVVSSDASAITQHASAGFGAGFAAAGATPADLRLRGGATPFDQAVPGGATPAATPAATHPAEQGQDGEASNLDRSWPSPKNPTEGRQTITQYVQWCEENDVKPTRADAAERFECSARSIGRYLKEMSPEIVSKFPPS